MRSKIPNGRVVNWFLESMRSRSLVIDPISEGISFKLFDDRSISESLGIKLILKYSVQINPTLNISDERNKAELMNLKRLVF